MRPGVALGVAALLLLLAAPASASPADISGTAALPLKLTGDAKASGTGEYLATGPLGTLQLTVTGTDGLLQRIQHRAFGHASTDPEVQVLWNQRTDRIPLPLAGATLTLESRAPGFQLLATGTGALASPAGDLLLGTLAEERTVDATSPPPVSVLLSDGTASFHQSIPAGRYAARATASTLELDGRLALFAGDAILTYRAADGSTLTLPGGFRMEKRPGQVYNPLDGTWTGPGTHDEYVTEYLLLEGEGHLTAKATQQPVTFHLPAPLLQLTGAATLPAMRGTVTVHDAEAGDATHTLTGQELRLEGKVALRAYRSEGTPATATGISGNGDVVKVSYGAVQAAYDWTGTITAVGLGALALAALGWLAAQGKTLLGLGGVGGALAGYARVAGDEVLEHPGRSEVYERVKAFPGVSFVQLQEAIGTSASTLNYHLRVLEKNGYVTPVRDGRYLRFFDRRSGHYSSHRKFAVSALRNPTSAAMARHIRDNPGVSQADLAQRFDVTPSTVTWHMTRLATAGLVEKQRDAHRTRYYVGQGWTQLPQDEQARQQTAVAA